MLVWTPKPPSQTDPAVDPLDQRRFICRDTAADDLDMLLTGAFRIVVNGPISAEFGPNRSAGESIRIPARRSKPRGRNCTARSWLMHQPVLQNTPAGCLASGWKGRLRSRLGDCGLLSWSREECRSERLWRAIAQWLRVSGRCGTTPRDRAPIAWTRRRRLCDPNGRDVGRAVMLTVDEFPVRGTRSCRAPSHARSFCRLRRLTAFRMDGLNKECCSVVRHRCHAHAEPAERPAPEC